LTKKMGASVPKRNDLAAKKQRLLDFVAEHAAVLCRQGSVQESWRWHGGTKLGPFYRIAWRHEGKQHAHYIGASADLAAAVRLALAGLQAPLHEAQERDRHIAEILCDLKAKKQEFRELLARQYLSLKGNEIRGWRSWRGRRRPLPHRRARGRIDEKDP
jgi:hypothetical protein